MDTQELGLQAFHSPAGSLGSGCRYLGDLPPGAGGQAQDPEVPVLEEVLQVEQALLELPIALQEGAQGGQAAAQLPDQVLAGQEPPLRALRAAPQLLQLRRGHARHRLLPEAARHLRGIQGLGAWPRPWPKGAQGMGTRSGPPSSPSSAGICQSLAGTPSSPCPHLPKDQRGTL